MKELLYLLQIRTRCIPQSYLALLSCLLQFPLIPGGHADESNASQLKPRFQLSIYAWPPLPSKPANPHETKQNNTTNTAIN